MSLRGYCRTLSERIDCRPAMRMTKLTTIDRTGRLTNKSVMRISAILRLRSPLVGRLILVVDENRRTVAKLEHAGCDDLLSWLPTRENRDLIAACGTELYKLLPYPAVCLPIRILEVLDDVYRIAIRRIADRRRRKRYCRPVCAQHNLRLHEHAGAEFSV